MEAAVSAALLGKCRRHACHHSSLLFLCAARNSLISMRLGYLYSRYPVISQTFCDAEMLALERRSVDLEIGSIHPPFTSFRHRHGSNLRAEICYAPSPRVVQTIAQLARRDGTWPAALVADHEARYGPGFKAEQRARYALFFAEQFVRSGVAHFHVHFARNATHTALFVKAISKIGFSFTAHAQDFMLDVGSDELLREMCRLQSRVARPKVPRRSGKNPSHLQRHRSAKVPGWATKAAHTAAAYLEYRPLDRV